MSNSGHLVWTTWPVSFHQATQVLTWPTHTVSEDKEAGFQSRTTLRCYVTTLSQTLIGVCKHMLQSSHSVKPWRGVEIHPKGNYPLMVLNNRLVSLLAMPKSTGAQSSQVKCARSRAMSTFGSTWALLWVSINIVQGPHPKFLSIQGLETQSNHTHLERLLSWLTTAQCLQTLAEVTVALVLRVKHKAVS